jgi:hypothetical protein
MHWIGGISLFLGIVSVLYMLCKCNRIRMGVALLDCSTDFINDVCSILLLPLILWIIYILMLIFLAFGCVYAYGIG